VGVFLLLLLLHDTNPLYYGLTSVESCGRVVDVSILCSCRSAVALQSRRLRVMAITYEQFCAGCAKLQTVLERLDDSGLVCSWKRGGATCETFDRYLELEWTRESRPCLTETESGDMSDVAEQHMEPQDTAVDTACAHAEPRHCLYVMHIVYHPVYLVPTALFRGRRMDGRLLMLQEIAQQQPALRLCLESASSQWTVVTQCTHPVLGTPFLMIHPCQTSAIMELLVGAKEVPALAMAPQREQRAAVDGEDDNRSSKYILGWFSMVGPLLGIRLPVATWATS
jgi:hypothetical protein